MNAKQIRDKLSRYDICFVRFEKKDGTIRNMICTTKNSKIPKDKKPSGSMDYDKSRQVRVFDIVAQEWRSMIPDNVLEIDRYGAIVADLIV